MADEADWIEVESSRLSAYRYDVDAASIFVRFPDGVIYRYTDCGPDVWRAFQDARSKGEFLTEVLEKCRYEQVWPKPTGLHPLLSEDPDGGLSTLLRASARRLKRLSGEGAEQRSDPLPTSEDD